MLQGKSRKRLNSRQIAVSGVQIAAAKDLEYGTKAKRFTALGSTWFRWIAPGPGIEVRPSDFVRNEAF